MDSRPPVLWKSLFRDIHATSDFDESKDLFLKRFRDFAGIKENTIQWLVRCQHGSSAFDGFSLATLVKIRSSKAPHCLIRRLNR